MHCLGCYDQAVKTFDELRLWNDMIFVDVSVSQRWQALKVERVVRPHQDCLAVDRMLSTPIDAIRPRPRDTFHLPLAPQRVSDTPRRLVAALTALTNQRNLGEGGAFIRND